MFLGAHMFVKGALSRTFEDAHHLGCDTLQLFTKNNNQWRTAQLNSEQIKSFRETRENLGFRVPIMAHDSYLINLASPKPDVYNKSLQAMGEEVQRCIDLGIDFLVMHPGAHLGTGEEGALKKIAQSLDVILRPLPQNPFMILLEITAGQGTNVGYKLEHIAEILNLISQQARVGVCVDTCHLFAAGYDLSTREGYEKTWNLCDQLFGLDRIKAFHLNDSKKGLGCRVDRHEHIGKGCIGLSAFQWLVNDERFQNVPAVLETPKGADYAEDRENLTLLKSLLL